MKITKLALLPLSFWACFAFAETTVGNGGDLVVCRNAQGQIESTEMLDYFEGRELRSLHIDIQSAEEVLDSLARLSPRRADRYRQLVRDFSANALFKSGIELTDIPDSDHDILPAGCKVEQLAIQRKPVFPEDKLYLVNKDLWDVMSPRDRAGLILHEIIYRDTIDAGKANSKTARYFNALISSNEFLKFSGRDYVKIVSLVFSPAVAGSEIEPVAGVLCDENYNTKIAFIVDTSGSNLETDPLRQRIADIKGFIRGFAQNPYCRWSIVTLGENPQILTNKNDIPAFEAGDQMEYALNALDAIEPSGGTPYRRSLFLAQSLLTAANPEQSPVKLVFVSDGVPTDEQSNEEVFAAVRSLVTSSYNVHLHTVLYGGSASGAENILKGMAQAGNGKFLNAHGHIDFGQLLF